MQRATQQTLIAAAMVLLGAVQAAIGLGDGALLYAGLGAVYGLIGVAYYWAEVYRSGGGHAHGEARTLDG